jgi:RNA polymerase sigma factor (sigma-70 family)
MPPPVGPARLFGHKSAGDASILVMATDQRDDQALLAATREGDGLAFAEFYRRHRGLVLRFVRQRVRSAEVAADLLAETFAAALAALLDPDRPLPQDPVAWLIRVARNKLIDSVRRGRVQDTARTRLALERLEISDEDVRRIERLAEAHDVAVRLREVLDREQLELLQSRIVEERAYADIAQELECSEAVVRKRVSRALALARLAIGGSP